VTIRQRRLYNGDHEALRNSVSRFLAGGAVDRPDFWSAAIEHGFVGLGAPDVGDPRFAALVLEEAMVAGLPALALALAVHDSFALPLLAGREVPGLAAVVDPADATVRAESSGDGWILHGSAESVLNAQDAALLVVVARTHDQNVVACVVDPAAPGFSRSPAQDLLGLESADVADLQFDGVAVAPGDRLEVDLDQARARYQLALAVAAAAGARTALATTVVYARDRKAFGTPIACFGNTRHVLGALGARMAAVEAFVDDGLERATELTLAEATALKLCATEVLSQAVDTGVQLHGGYGYMWEYPIARAYAAAPFFRLHVGVGEHADAVLSGAIGLAEPS
jgi:alkylation response protein AidB-like acyl-CoA dehydrogenase